MIYNSSTKPWVVILFSTIMAATVQPRNIEAAPQSNNRMENSITVESRTVADWAKDAIVQNMPWSPDQTKVSVFPRFASIHLQSETFSHRVRFTKNEDFVGNIPVEVEFYTLDGEKERSLKSVWLMAEVSVFSLVVTAKEPISRDTILTEDLFIIEERKSNEIPPKSFHTIDDLIGKISKTYIRQGQVISAREVSAPFIVHAGDSIEILAKNQHITLKTIGIVKQDGRKGDIIPIMNLGSKKIVYATVINENISQVSLD